MGLSVRKTEVEREAGERRGEEGKGRGGGGEGEGRREKESKGEKERQNGLLPHLYVPGREPRGDQ